MRLLLILLVTLGLSGCAALQQLNESVISMTDYYLGGEDNSEPPAELVEYQPEIDIALVWKHDIGVGFDDQYLKITPALDSGKIIVADREGLVEARDALSGKLIWRVETDLQISSGPGVGNGSVILGTSKAEVLALDVNTGEERWRTKVTSEILAIPKVIEDAVLVRTADGKHVALHEDNGKEIWMYSKNVPALSIRGTGYPVYYEGNVIAGYANGKMISLRLSDGGNVWETSIAIPKGRSEVERIVDLDSDPAIVDEMIFISSYQDGIFSVIAYDGDILWNNEEISSYLGFGIDSRYLYVSDSESDVWQLDQRNGASLWKQEELHQRSLTAPAAYEDYVVVGDFEGFVHWLSTADGRQLGRKQVTDEALIAQPLVFEDMVYVYANDGTLAALRVTSR